MDADVALLQEAGRPPAEVAEAVELGQGDPWMKEVILTGGPWWSNYRIECESSGSLRPSRLTETKEGEIVVSDIGTIAAARIIPLDGGRALHCSVHV